MIFPHLRAYIAFLFLLNSYSVFAANNSCENPALMEFGTNDLVAASLVEVKSVFHEIKLNGSELEINSTYKIDLLMRAQQLCSIVVRSDLGAKVSFESRDAAKINGDAANITNFSGIPGYFQLSLPAINLPRTFDLQLHYKISRFQIDTISHLNASDFLSPARIVERNLALGVDKRNPISYADKVISSALIDAPQEYFATGSGETFKNEQKWFVSPTNAGNFTVVIAKNDAWKKSFFKIEGTQFVFFARTNASTIDPISVEKAVRFAWPRYVAQFGRYTDFVNIIEADGPLGGGAIGSNILALYSMDKIPSDLQKYIESVSGVPALNSTRAYAEQMYSKSKNPLFDYIATITIHELGHLYFGFGQASERYPETYQAWFSLGLGITYDNAIFQQMTGYRPALFEIMEEKWRLRFDTILGIDQRLQSPDTSADQAHGVLPFHRVQLYAHSKSEFVLRQLRECAGAQAFDHLAKLYVNQGGATDGYLSFRKDLARICPNLPQIEFDLKIL